MAAGKWNIGTVNVGGQAMFGDNNRMQVETGLNADNPAAVAAAISRIRESVQSPEFQEKNGLSAREATDVERIAGELVGELKRPKPSQNPTFLRQCLHALMQTAKAVPTLVSTATELKTLLGL